MDTQKYENFKCLMIILICCISTLTLANDNDSLNILKESYQHTEANDGKLLIKRLQDAYQKTESRLLKERIQYRMGMLYFKASDLKQAFDQFQSLSMDGQCSTEIQIAAINMAAQTARMQAHDSEALAYYDKLIQKYIEISKDSIGKFESSALEEMYISSVSGKAEIYIFQKKYGQAVNEYTQAIQIMKDGFYSNSSKYLPSLYDSISQLYLKSGNIQKYLEAASIIIEDYNDYDRTAMVKLESFAVQFINEKKGELDYTKGSSGVFVQLILYVKEVEDRRDIERIDSTLKQLMDQSKIHHNEWLIGYHYAWFLDAIGKQDESCKLFGEIVTGIEADSKEMDYVTQSILTYSKLQKALMDGEHERYKEGLECLDSIKNDMKGSHVSKLSDSIRYSLETLKREVPKNEN